MNSDTYTVFLSDLLKKERIEENDIFVVEDEQNTKQVSFRNLKLSLIDDNELPASHRLYSSRKMDIMIGEIEEKVVKGIGSVQGDILELDRTKVSKQDLSLAIKDLDDVIQNKETIQKIITELEATRKTADPITGKDLAYGTEDEKIHLKHLGSDILDAMTGHTEVSIPSVPTGGWTGDDLANESIGAKKLKKDYSYRGNYPQGNINRLVQSGYYEVASTVEGVPHYKDDMNETRLLEVIRYGIDGKYIIQRVYYKERTDETRPYFERKGLFSKLSVLEFVAKWEVGSDNRVDSSLLANHYNNRGTLYDGDIFAVSADGNYLCESTVRNLPTRDKYLVNIRSFSDRREFEAKKADISGCITYVCYEYKDSAGSLVRSGWFNITNILKSKFDNQEVHIFGDGISFGMGASNLSKKSYSSILRDKYGYKVYNHSLTDATVGIYEDDILRESSVITQVDESTGIVRETDMYAIIFAGAEDYRCGLADIGLDTDKGENTFKGAYNFLIDRLLLKAPKCKIMLVTPIFRASTEPGDSMSGDDNMVNGKYLRDYAQAVVDIGKYNHIPVLDLYSECMINKYNYSSYLNDEGVYPSDEGHTMLAEKIHNGMLRYY